MAASVFFFFFVVVALVHSLHSCSVKSISMSLSFASSDRAEKWLVKSWSSSKPVPSPYYRGPRPKHHRHQHGRHRVIPHPVAPSPSKGQACDKICTGPFTPAPFGSPCGCVLPMKVGLKLGVAPLAVFPVINALETEIAIGTYLQQSQVKILGVNADSLNQGGTIVDINLVPLEDKFDNTTAVVILKRFLYHKVHINGSLFGDYEVLCVTYPGMPSWPPHGSLVGSCPQPSESAGGSIPFTANVVSKNPKMDFRIICIIALSSLVLLLILIGAYSIILKWRKFREPSSAVGPSFTLSPNKKPALESMLSSRLTSSRSMSLMSTMATSILSIQTFSLSELQNATDNFSSERVLGEGGFGRVYCGTLDDGAEVAVKLLRDNQNGDREFIAEVEMLCRLHHRNLVKLIGICIEGLKRCLVYELVHNGSVESHLHGVDKENSPLDWEARMKIALGAARGLAYLHEDSNPRVIHRDFKSSNVLLGDDFSPKVSDFGLAREATEGSHHISTRVMGTFGYVAPEYAMTGHLIVKSDVYSYGVVLLELLTGRKPVDMSQPQGQENLVAWARPLLTNREGLEQLVDPSLAGSCNFDDMAKVAAIASVCVHLDATQRPFMGEVVQALKLIYNDADETCGDCNSWRESSTQESDYRGDLLNNLSSSRWWNDERTPRLTNLQASPFITMEYSSGPLEKLENTPIPASKLIGGEISIPIRYGNRSGPLIPERSKLSLYRLARSWSEHGILPSKHVWNGVHSV